MREDTTVQPPELEALVIEELMAAGRHAEAAEAMEAELARLDGQSGPAFATRRAQRHRLLGQLWHEQLGRVDRALEHYRKAAELEPHGTEALAAARAIYLSL